MPEDTGALGTAYVQFSADLSKIQVSLEEIKKQTAESATFIEKKMVDGFKGAAESSGISIAGIAAKFTLVQLAVEKTIEYLRKIPETIQESTLLNARVETLGVVVGVVGKNAMYTRAEMDKYVEGIKKMGITTQESMTGVIRMAQAHIDLANSAKIARLAQDAAVIANTNSSEAFNRLVLGIQRGETEILRTMGINVSFEQSYEKMAVTLNKTASALTEQEKVGARVNAVMEKSKDIAGAYEAAMSTVGKQFLSMPRYIEETKNQFGELFKPAMGVLIQGFTGLLKKMSDQMSEYKKSGKWDELSNSFSTYAKILIDGISKAVDAFIMLAKVLVTFRTEITAAIIALTAFKAAMMIEGIILKAAAAVKILRDAIAGFQLVAGAAALGGIKAAWAALAALIGATAVTVGAIVVGVAAALGVLTYAIIKDMEAEEEARKAAIKYGESLKYLSDISLEDQIKALEQEKLELQSIGGSTEIVDKKIKSINDEVLNRKPEMIKYFRELAGYVDTVVKGANVKQPELGTRIALANKESKYVETPLLDMVEKEAQRKSYNLAVTEEYKKQAGTMGNLLLPTLEQLEKEEKIRAEAINDALQKMNKENTEANKKKEQEILKQLKEYDELFLKQEDEFGKNQLVKAEYTKNKLKDITKSHLEWEYEFSKKMRDTENSALELVQTEHQKKMRTFDKEYIESKRALQQQDYERDTKDNNNLLGEYGKFWSKKTELIFQHVRSVKQAYEIIRDEEKKHQEAIKHTMEMQKAQREQDLKVLEFRKERGEVGEKEVINKKYENEQRDIMAQIAAAIDEFQGFKKEVMYATEVDKLVGETKNNNVVFRDSVEVFRKAVELLSGKSSGTGAGAGGKSGSTDEIMKTYGAQLSKYFAGNEQIMAKIMYSESRGDPNAFNPGGGGKGALGLFQIRGQLHEQALKSAGIIESVKDLYDIEKNFQAAAYLYKQAGTRPWDASKSAWGKEGAATSSATTSSKAGNFAGSLNYTGESSIEQLKIEKQTKLNMLLESLYDKMEKSKQLNKEELLTNDEKIRQAKQEYEWKKELTDLEIINKDRLMNEWTIAEKQLNVYKQQAEYYKERVQLSEKDSLVQIQWMEKLDGVTKSIAEVNRELRNLNGTFEEGVSMGLRDYEKSMKTTFEYGKQVIPETATAIKSTFTSVFSDLRKGELKTFESYFTSFANKILDTWSNMLFEMLSNWIVTEDAMKNKTSSGGGLGSIISGIGSRIGNWLFGKQESKPGYSEGTDLSGENAIMSANKQEDGQKQQLTSSTLMQNSAELALTATMTAEIAVVDALTTSYYALAAAKIASESMGSSGGGGSSGYSSGGTATASAAGGYDIPSGKNPLVKTHEKEMILPAKYADVIRSMASMSTGSGNASPVVTSPKIGVEINMKDHTSNKTKMTETDRKYDAQAKKFVINTILEDYSNGGSSYSLIGRK